jgi:hypothetical protein
MKILFILDDPPSGTERIYDGLVSPDHELAIYLGLEMELTLP